MKKNLILASLIICISTLFFFSLEEEKPNISNVEKFKQAPSAIGSKENPAKRFDYELKQMIDPVSGKVPDFIHHKEIAFSNKIPTKNSLNSANERVIAQNWNSDGPSNIGGRTRAVALDILNENTILAGGVSGGMWKSTNNGTSWVKTSHPNTINSSTCLIQDTRAGKENRWYQGTGELRGNSARAPGAPYRGDGIFKSTDNGDSWDLIPSTTNNQLSVFESPFNYIWNIVVNTKRTDIDEIFAAVYGGIVRSQDGGNTWKTVLGDDLLNQPEGSDLNDSNAPFFTNIIQTNTGIFYATLSVFSTGETTIRNGKGIFRSTDGENWEKISPNTFSSNHSRTVMGFSASNNNIIYFFVADETPQLWKYDDNQSSSGWTNLTNNLPAESEDFEGLDTQESFNMVVKIHPEKENVVFLGGTNLFKSTDGFSTSNNTTWIGGYGTDNDGALYAGHHPDQHDLIFHPSDPDKCISAHDGGLSFTSNNLVEEPQWVSLSNGYVTSQFYTISLSPDKGNDAVMGGMQDNGSYAKNSTIESPPWNRLLGGDGAFCSTTPGDIYWYVSFQESQIYRLTLNDDFRLTSFARVDPVGSSEDYLFINPFVLDPNNYNRMYMPNDNVLWRNDNLSQVISGSQEKTSTNWLKMDRTAQASQISALDISTNPQNTLYFGTSQGSLIKVTDANLSTYTSTLRLSNSGYISNVTIDPSNVDNVMVIYSNYNIPSIFFSSNGGNEFTDMGGNLEENTDGTGNGPSIRWSEIIPMADGSYQYFVGTSTGLYSTDKLDGENTLWVKEGNDIIGNSVIRMMDYRSSDGKMVIATHGNGVFETIIDNTLEVKKESSLKENISVNNIYPNPFDGKNPVKIDFDIPTLGVVRIDIINNLGQLVKTLLHATQFPGNNIASWDGTNSKGTPVKDGMYHYRVAYGDNIITGNIIFDR